MLISYNWLQTYFDTTLPSPEEIEEKLTFHSFEIEGVEKVGDDSVIDIDVLPNRAHDCLSHRGIAKELSVLFNTPLKEDVFRGEGKELKQSELLSVDIDNSLLCRRYMGVVIQGIKVGPSPCWLIEHLEAIGQKSINNIVDATNYVMFSLGQPLHAFDSAKLEQKDGKYNILVREAKKGEKITVLSGDEYELTDSNLLIVDGNTDGPVGIAGVKGGNVAEVDENTTDMIIESANFNPAHTRKTSQYLKLRTDASTRFENELSPEVAYYGLTEVVKLIQELAEGKVEGYVDEYPLRKSIEYKKGVSVEEINKLLGTQISQKEVEDILSKFGFSYEKVNPIEKVLELAPTLKGIPYKYGASISYDAPNYFDCSSFVGYVCAQAGVSIPRMAIDQFVYGSEIDANNIKEGDIVFSLNSNSKDHSFVRTSDGVEVTHSGAKDVSQEFLPGTKVSGGVSHNGIYIGDGKVIHASPEKGVIIETLEESEKFKHIVGYRRIVDNKERYVVEIPFERLDLRITEDLIEEMARVYGYENIGEEVPKKEGYVSVDKKYYYAEKIRDFLTQKGFVEVYTYSLRNNGELEIENPLASDKNFVRHALLDGIEDGIALNEKNKNVLGLEEIKIFEIGNIYMGDTEHTSVCIGSSDREEVESVVALLSKELSIDFKGELLDNTYEFNLDESIESLPEPKEYDVKTDAKDFVYEPFSLFPSALRDIAVWVPKSVSSDTVLSLITEKAGDLLVQDGLFDEYKKDGRVSYAFKLVFQSQEKTLSDADVNKVMKKVTDDLNNQDGFEVR